MSKLVEQLKNDLISVFGSSFGQIAEGLTEAKKLSKKDKAAAELKSGAQRIRKNEKDRARRNLGNFFSHADKEGEKSASKPRPSKIPSGGGGGAVASKTKKTAGGSGGMHNPFKHSSSLGVGPGTPPGFRQVHGKRHHNERKCWHCTCGDVYTKGCTCIGSGATKDCPKGHQKHVQIHKAYRHAYNDMYHAWRRNSAR